MYKIHLKKKSYNILSNELIELKITFIIVNNFFCLTYRNDNSLEIWNLTNAPCIEAVIPGQADYSIEAIVWIGARLFTCGLSGIIDEYDFLNLSITSSTDVIGGAAWCMDINSEQTLLAVGTEKGRINILSITEEPLDLWSKKSFADVQQGRILCITWDLLGKMIYTGSVDSVRVWNVSTEQCTKMITCRKDMCKKETIVWCIAVGHNNSIITGDSQGTLCIWDPKMGVLIESHDSHAADILAIATSQDKKVIYCAGVDPVIRTFTEVIVRSTGRAQWVRGIERRLHVHDVRALVEADGKLYSAGVDGYLAQSSYPPKTLVKYPPLLQPPCAYACPKSRCIMLRYHNYLEVWKLGKAAETNENDVSPGNIYRLQDEPVKILQLMTKNDENIVSCAISRNSRIIIYSTENHLRVFNFNLVDGVAQLSKQDSDIPNKKTQKMLFSPSGKFFATVNYDGKKKKNVVTLYSVNEDHFLSFHASFSTSGKELREKNREELIERVNLMCFSDNDKYLILADHKSRIAVYNIEGDLTAGPVEAWPLPKYDCLPTAIAVQKETYNLVIVYSDHKVNMLKQF